MFHLLNNLHLEINNSETKDLQKTNNIKPIIKSSEQILNALLDRKDRDSLEENFELVM